MQTHAISASKKKLLVITPAFSGGSWICILRIMDLFRDDFRITVIGLGHFDRDINGVNIISIPYPRYDRWGLITAINPAVSFIWNFPLLLCSIFYIIFNKPQFILVNGFTTGLLIAPVARILNINTIVEFHGYLESYLGNLAKRIVKLLAGSVDLVIVNSKGAAKEVNAIIDNKKIVINEHFADDLFFSNKLEKKYNNKLDILYIGRLDREKFCDNLINVAVLLKNNPLFSFCFIGVGELADDVIKLQKESNNIVYAGYISDRKQLSEYYMKADLVWSYADETYLALPAVEALACGIPVIVPDAAVVPSNSRKGIKINKDLVPEGIGWIVNAHNTQAAVKLLNQLAENRIYIQLRQYCRQYALKKYSRQNIINTYNKINSLNYNK